MTQSLVERVKVRLKDDDVTPSEEIINELVTTVTDRVCLRIGEDTLPVTFNSIVVDATIKMYRKQTFEGMSSDGAAGATTSFVNDTLDEYSLEFSEYKQNKANQKEVRFL